MANRPSSAIRLIVIHVTESSAIGAISWFKNPRAQGSANYVVSDTGHITQMVRDSDIAWHAGNWAINRESIGIEHAGYTYRKGTFTDAEYRASAQLVGYELRRLLLPIDRKHVIGHSEVPDPNHKGQFGGFAHHTDPGPYWDWKRYMRYVSTYAHGSTPAPTFAAAPSAVKAPAKPAITAKVTAAGKVSVASSGLKDGQTVGGYVKWAANVGNADVTRVDFLVDGRLRWSEKQKPFEFGGDGDGWDTTRETNGAHVLTLRVVGKKGATAGQSIRVTVANSPFEIAAASVSNGQTVKGKVPWEAVPAGAKADHVDFLVDGKLVHTEKEAPYVLDGDWDTTKAGNGVHTLGLRAVSVDGRVAESSVTVVVANPEPPKPKPVTPISITMKGVSGQVSGVVRWEGVVAGGKPERVEFWIDGRWRWTQRSAPYVINWDTTREQAGPHVLSVRALGANGLVWDVSTATTTVQSRVAADAAPAPASMTVTSSIADGATVQGGVAWTAAVTGTTPARVEFSIDGTLRHTERSAPYEFGTWDTTQEQNGPHTLNVRAVAPDGTKVETSETVVVANTRAELAVASSIADGSTIGGTVTWTATTTAARVEFVVDGTVRRTDTSAPFTFTWDTTAETPGRHALAVKAYADGRVAQQSLSVTVANAAAQPLAVTALTLSGSTWTATTSGPTPDRVEFWVDGALAHTERSAPYEFPAPTGAHEIVAKAFAGSQVAQRSVSLAADTTTDTTIVSQSLTDGQTVSGSLTWTVVTSGRTPDRVEYWIDGTLAHTERSAPYEFAWDTKTAADGAHTLVTKAYAGGTTVQRTLTVTVRNAAPAPPASQQPVAVVSQTIADGQTLSGSVSWLVTASGPVQRVQLWIDGTRVATFRNAPYGGTLDTKRLSNGAHTFVTKVSGTDGSSATATIAVTVANA